MEQEIRLLEVQGLNFAVRYIADHMAREYYIRNIQAYVTEVRANVTSGAMSNEAGARAANEMRNQIMTAARNRSSDIGRAAARGIKANGLSFDDAVQRQTSKLYGRAFDTLDADEKRKVMDAIVASAGKDNAKVTGRVRRLGKAARVLFVMTIAVSAYNIYTAEDRSRAAQREGASFAGGFLGGAAMGATAGIWLGPVGVAVFAAVGGVVGAIMADEVYLEVAGYGHDGVDALIDPHTGFMHTDVDALATTLVTKCGIDMGRVLDVFTVLERDRSMASDNVAAAYLEKVRRAGGTVVYALRGHNALRAKLIALLEGGYTSGRERDLASWVKSL